MLSTYFLYTKCLTSGGQLSSQSFLGWYKNAFAKVGFKGKPLATPSICLYKVLLKIKDDS